MSKTPGYSAEGEIVTLTMSHDDYEKLLYSIGIAGSQLDRPGDRRLLYVHLALANRLNAGNPNWTPYEVPPPKLVAPEHIPTCPDELMDYIERFADVILVRDKVDGIYADVPLSKLPTARGLGHIFRWLRTGQTPHRAVGMEEVH